MEDQGTKDGAKPVTGSKADQKKDSTEGPLSETEVCSDFGFIEPALKCTCSFHNTWKFSLVARCMTMHLLQSLKFSVTPEQL